MKGKIVFLAGAAAGYVLGSKAGRQAYEQIKAQAQKTWNDPKVQKTVEQAGQAAKDAAAAAQSRISEAVSRSGGSGTSDDSRGGGAGTGTTDASDMTGTFDTSDTSETTGDRQSPGAAGQSPLV